MSSHSGSPFTNQRDFPSDPTMAHLLALPPILQPISPSLAALHLARVRLLLDIPTTSTAGSITEWWCHSCGGLREGLGGTSGSGSKSKSRGKRKIPSKKVIGEKRKGAVCTNCGERFKRMKSDKGVLNSYPSARIASRRKAKELELKVGQDKDPFVVKTKIDNEAMDVDPVPVDISGVTRPQVGAFGMMIPGENVIDPTKKEDTRRPIFNRVKDTEPNLPTYPPPTPSTGSPEKAKKRKKKSGLAKLLAENKERAAAQNLGGSWGLG